ncbi:hypothetical protein R1sor_010603 [Riccia sorocarpa]|uniref:Uncharacterized protein n=1 Tax=Riccia sorocarpa TaxID=122646 RepID=A0ABD3HYI4_9MARC
MEIREQEEARFPASEVDLTPRHGYMSSRQNLLQAVITIFFGTSPLVQAFQSREGQLWDSLPDVTIEQVRALSRGNFKTMLSSRAAQLRVLQAPAPTIHDVPSVTIPWTLDAELPDFQPPIRPTWWELPAIPSWAEQDLTDIFQAIGPILHIPTNTLRLRFSGARAQVLWDFTKPLRTHIPLRLGSIEPEAPPQPDYHIDECHHQQAQHADQVRQLLDQRLHPRPSSPIPTASAPERTDYTFIFGMELNPIVHRPASPLPPIKEHQSRSPASPQLLQQPVEVDPAPLSHSASTSSIHTLPQHIQDTASSQLGDPRITQTS